MSVAWVSLACALRCACRQMGDSTQKRHTENNHRDNQGNYLIYEVILRVWNLCFYVFQLFGMINHCVNLEMQYV